MTNEARPTSIFPDLHLLCIADSAVTAWEAAVTKYFPTLHSRCNIQIHQCGLKYLPTDLTFDAIVSPANSYARLDGAYDDALARAFQPSTTEYDWITRKAQSVVYERYRGYVPPGTCTVVPLDHDVIGDAAEKNPWRTKFLLLCPTMRIPWDVRWDREVVYECVWTLLCAVDAHNRGVKARLGQAAELIKSVMMTPLATGCGSVSYERWAAQTVIAMKNFDEAVEKPEVWGQMQWKDVFERQGDLIETWDDEGCSHG